VRRWSKCYFKNRALEGKTELRIKTIALLSLLLLGSLSGGCSPTTDFDSHLSSIVKPYSFSIVKWEVRAVSNEANKRIFSQDKNISEEVYTILGFFSSVERIDELNSQIEAINASSKQGDLTLLENELNMLQGQRMAVASTVERVIEEQIKETLAQQGISNPIDEYIRLGINFPPINFKLEEPPYLLVVSPRDRIESMREVLLKQNLTLDEMEETEAKVDRLGVSSLVVEIGGLGATYPSFVTNEASLRFTIETATEEWVHQYLVFRPLGLLYLLDLTGVSRNYEIATMNETLAGMVSTEIGAIVYEKYYSQYEIGAPNNGEVDSAFDFNREMREIRRVVDSYLARGEIEQAEDYMEQKRQYIASKGYYIRKLNQAYFAYHGAYAGSPTSISPIGLELQELREQSASLKDFLNTAAAMTSRQDLIDSIE